MIEQTIAQSIVEEPEHVDYGKIDERVLRGVRFLDLKQPGWADSIDLENFDLTDGGRCVLGQVYGSYFATADSWWGEKADDEAGHRGFYDESNEYGTLEDDWVKVITERQQQPVA